MEDVPCVERGLKILSPTDSHLTAGKVLQQWIAPGAVPEASIPAGRSIPGGGQIVRQFRRPTYLFGGVVGYTTSVSSPQIAH